jgi:predicted DNA-binding transcriptional regulator YafY
VAAQVAFSAKIARWLKEKYPDGREQRDGRYIVTFQVADPAWFVREVLQYGAEAEVLRPEALREAVRNMVAAQ